MRIRPLCSQSNHCTLLISPALSRVRETRDRVIWGELSYANPPSPTPERRLLATLLVLFRPPIWLCLAIPSTCRFDLSQTAGTPGYFSLDVVADFRIM